MTSLRSLQIIGVHPVVPTDGQFREAVVIQYGEDLAGRALAQAEHQVREHFAGLYLLEIEINPADAQVDWSTITQPIPGEPRENWQVPYDERRLRERGNRWVFFFHFLDLACPLQTPLGNRPLPPASPTPEHLHSIVYEVPG